MELEVTVGWPSEVLADILGFPGPRANHLDGHWRMSGGSCLLLEI